jgi:hypothetical protein
LLYRLNDAGKALDYKAGHPNDQIIARQVGRPYRG